MSVVTAATRILHLEDSRRDADLIRDLLEADGTFCELVHVDSRAGFEAALAEGPYDVLICDFNLPDLDGLAALAMAQERLPGTPVIVVSGVMDAAESVACLHAGATDYLLKQRLERLPWAVTRALAEAAHRRKSLALQAQLRDSDAFARAVLNALPDHIAVLDSEGIIVAVNDTWRRFARDNGGPLPTIQPMGTSYLSVVEQAAAQGDPSAHAALDGIRAVLSDTKDTFTLDYSCHAPDRQRWFAMVVRPRSDGRGGVVVAHRDITDRVELEAQFRQAQKMESVGRLASGVAHEINTPVQFVSDSIHFMKEGIADLKGLIAKYRAVQESVEAGSQSASAVRDARTVEDEIDLTYLLENMPRAIDRALEGLSRIASIVNSMKDFARADQREMSNADLNAAILSTLTIARNEYKYVADLDTDLGELPPVMCRIGELNQVMVNLIVNAAHAIGDVVKDSGAKGRIAIRTRRDDDHVVIEVSDTGTGVPEEIRNRIFDPFVTTKELGKGTGQGLAIAWSIVVDKHGGSLRFNSEAGRGTTFVVRLPTGGPTARDAKAKALSLTA